jgi:two-component system OmpR family response regulator
MTTKILVMDDEVDTLNMLAMTLRFAGYEVATATTGQKTLALCDEFKPDLIFLDVMMPDISGIDVLKMLKQRWPQLPPVVFLSASIRSEDIEAGLAAGAHTYLVKPVLRQKLIDTVKSALSSKET